MKKNVFRYILVCKRPSNDDVGAARGTVFPGMRPGAGFKTGDFVGEKLRGLPQNDFGHRQQTIVSNVRRRLR